MSGPILAGGWVGRGGVALHAAASGERAGGGYGGAPGDVRRKSREHLLAAPLDLDHKVR